MAEAEAIDVAADLRAQLAGAEQRAAAYQHERDLARSDLAAAIDGIKAGTEDLRAERDLLKLELDVTKKAEALWKELLHKANEERDAHAEVARAATLLLKEDREPLLNAFEYLLTIGHDFQPHKPAAAVLHRQRMHHFTELLKKARGT